MVCLFFVCPWGSDTERERQKREGHEVGYVEMWDDREDLEGIEWMETDKNILSEKMYLKKWKKTRKSGLMWWAKQEPERIRVSSI